MKTFRHASKRLILVIFLALLIGYGIGYAVELYQEQFFCQFSSECIVFGSFKILAAIAIVYLLAMSLLLYFFKFRNKFISAIYLASTLIFIYVLLLLFNRFIILTPSYMEVHDVNNFNIMARFSQKINYDDIAAFQYRWTKKIVVRRGRGHRLCNKKAYAVLRNGNYFDLSAYGFGQGNMIMGVIRNYRNIRISNEVGYKDRICRP